MPLHEQAISRAILCAVGLSRIRVSMVLLSLSAHPHKWMRRITSTPWAPSFQGCSMSRTTIRVPSKSCEGTVNSLRSASRKGTGRKPKEGQKNYCPACDIEGGYKVAKRQSKAQKTDAGVRM